MAQGIPDVLSSRGMNGFHALRVTCSGMVGSLNFRLAKGNSPVKVQLRKRGSPSRAATAQALTLQTLIVNAKGRKGSFDDPCGGDGALDVQYGKGCFGRVRGEA
jgi:hypothetical protein